MAPEVKPAKTCPGQSDDSGTRILYQRIRALELSDLAGDPSFEVYRLLADVISVLQGCYSLLGIHRPLFQVHADALGITLTALSEDTQDPEKSIREQLAENTARFHDLPEDFDTSVLEIIEDRKRKQQRITPQQFLEDVFSAYLASRSMNEEDWIRENRDRL